MSITFAELKRRMLQCGGISSDDEENNAVMDLIEKYEQCKSSVVHFDAQGKGMYAGSNMAECGETLGRHRLNMRRIIKKWKPLELTTNPADVTCKRCKKTKAYKEAVEKEEKL